MKTKDQNYPAFLFAGRLQRDYLLPEQGRPQVDIPGGGLLYAAAGLGVWEADEKVGLLARAGEDYPEEWLRWFKSHGWDTRGIHVLAEALDLRYFEAREGGDASAAGGSDTEIASLPLQSSRSTLRPYDSEIASLPTVARNDRGHKGIARSNPVAHYARLGLPFPKSLLGYQMEEEVEGGRKGVHPAAPRPGDIPADYLQARAAHVCPLDYLSACSLSSTLRRAGVSTLTLDPTAAYMSVRRQEEVRVLLQGLTAFLPSEEELRGLFWGQTDDLWEIAEALGDFGCEYVVVKCGALGTRLFDAVSRKRWEVPAYPARAADPHGAGDSFCGGFLAGYQRTFDPLQGALQGCVSASLTIEGSGVFHALEALPGLAQRRLDSLRGLVREV